MPAALPPPSCVRSPPWTCCCLPVWRGSHTGDRVIRGSGRVGGFRLAMTWFALVVVLMHLRLPPRSSSPPSVDCVGGSLAGVAIPSAARRPRLSLGPASPDVRTPEWRCAEPRAAVPGEGGAHAPALWYGRRHPRRARHQCVCGGRCWGCNPRALSLEAVGFARLLCLGARARPVDADRRGSSFSDACDSTACRVACVVWAFLGGRVSLVRAFACVLASRCARVALLGIVSR